MSLRAAAGLLGSTGVTLGAFGAHALKKILEERGTLDSWRTAVQYQLLHAVALLALSGSAHTQSGTAKQLPTFAKLWVGGTLLFSGSIYLLALGGPRILGPVTPLGGFCLIGGWVALLL